MAGNFNSSSFIPKGGFQHTEAQSSDSGPSRFGLLLSTSSVLFVLAALAAGGVFFYTQSLESSLAEKEAEFEQAQGVFEPETVDRLTTIDKRISAAKTLLNQHTAVTPVFDVIESVTLVSVQLNSVTMSANSSGGSGEEDEAGGEGTPGITPAGLEDDTLETPDVEMAEESGTSTNATASSNSGSAASSGGTVGISMTGTAPSYPSLALQVEALEDDENVRSPTLSDFSLGSQGDVEFSVEFSISDNYMSYKDSLE